VTGWVGNIEEATQENTTFRTVLFTGEHAQLTVMSIQPGDEIGLEAHDDIDQFLRIEQGRGRVVMGPAKDQLDESYDVSDDWAVIIPAGTWHNVINRSDGELKLYSIYSPAEHPPDTVHPTKADADAAEAEHHH
jgi:mannose-6-phosphate isomerase-like protein (cupin superfamily)